MNLEKFSKADLIWIIKRMQVYHLGDMHFNRALEDLEFDKEERALQETDQQIQIAHDARVEYLNIMKPYTGCPIGEIPDQVLIDAGNALKRAEEADKKWAKLSKIKGAKKCVNRD